MIIETHALTKAYGLQPVLRKIDLGIERGEFVALLGANGSGKSTLLRLLCALTKPTAGSIKVGGWELPKEAAAVRSQIGLVSHKSLVYDNLTAIENLRFFARVYGLDDIDGRIKRGLERVGLGKRGGDLVRTYSRGMLQRLSIARALIHNPDVLLLDEPYTGLDQDASGILDSLLVQAHGDGKTIIMVTHELDRAQRLAQRAIIISRGAIVLDAPMSSIEYLPARYTEVTGMTTR
ncbi:MAG: ABC transporter ATP-binding protein [Chloroflexi bacterium]|uniref:ABC transporter ATP-binding protein n=1 Tax=Candidatus Flexifilum breve TaxID=3140694 RepID=UPI0031364C97|nr:ABC transporter ATP-binding protein [Chloroflexota bacterium]